MKKSWTVGLDDQVASDITLSFKSSSLMRNRLKDLLLDKSKQSNTTARSKTTYSNPNWAYLQADNVGYERALHEIIELISE